MALAIVIVYNDTLRTIQRKVQVQSEEFIAFVRSTLGEEIQDLIEV